MRQTKGAKKGSSAAIGSLELVDYSYFLYLTWIFFLLILVGRDTPKLLRQLTIHGGFFLVGVIILWVSARRAGRFAFFCRVWYIPFLFFFLFQEVGRMVHVITPTFLDLWVIRLETEVFGGYPTVWLQSLANPWLTELMSFFYMTYYFLIPALGLTLYCQQKWEWLNDLVLTTSVTFFFCLIHYLFMPVAGPIFLPNAVPFELVSLRGGPLTVFEQWLFFKGAIQGAAFPSSHVAIAVVVLFFAIRYRRYPYGFTITVSGLAVSTVYNGYHYGVDVVYGILVGLVFSLVCPVLNRWWKDWLTIPALDTKAEESFSMDEH
jgi:membrane-associated phospholipid phosphatase